MKLNLIVIINLLVLSFFVSCVKETPDSCAKLIIANSNHLISNELLEQMGYRLNVIEASGEYQIRSYTTDPYGENVKCYQFYKGLPVYLYDVNFVFSKANGLIVVGNEVDSINISFEPLVSHVRAAEIAHERMKFEQCYDVILGIYDINAGINNQQAEFKLVWKITIDNNMYPYAIIDAQNEKMISYDSGIRN